MNDWFARSGLREQILLAFAAIGVFALGVELIMLFKGPVIILAILLFCLAAILGWSVFAISYAHRRQYWLAETVDISKEVRVYGGRLLSIVSLGLVIGSWRMLVVHPWRLEYFVWVLALVMGILFLVFISKFSPFSRPILVLNQSGIGGISIFVPWEEVDTLGGMAGTSFGGYMSSLLIKTKKPGCYYRFVKNVASKLFIPIGGMSIAPERIIILAQKYLVAAREHSSGKFL